MSIDKLKHYLTILNLPSGVIMGIYTLVIIGLSIAAFVRKQPIDGSILTAYGMVAGLFSINKTTKAIMNKPSDTPPQQ